MDALDPSLKLLLLEALDSSDDDDDSDDDNNNDDGSTDLFFLIASVAALTGNKMTFRDVLDAEGRARRCRKIPRCALVDPDNSPWHKLYHSGHNGAMITVTGHDYSAFHRLLELFAPLFHKCTPWTGYNDGATYKEVKKITGRPRKTTAEACLGLVLAWCRFSGPMFILQGWFGFTGTPATVWLKFGRRMMLRAIQHNQMASIRWPTDEDIDMYKNIIKRQHPALKHVFCVADGLKLPFESTSDDEEQGKCYNGWTHGHCVTNLLLFAPDGRLIAAVINAPGPLHDSTLAEWGGVHDKLEATYNRTGGICCLDSAFQSMNTEHIVKSSNDESNADGPLQLVINRQATSLRQAAEWGMRAAQGSFPRLKEKMKCEECGKERQVYLTLMCLLCNFRLEHVGLNQIRNVYVPEWSKDASHFIDNN